MSIVPQGELLHATQSTRLEGLLHDRPRASCPKDPGEADSEGEMKTSSGGELDQIQFLLGPVSVQTAERYLGCKERIRSAVNDRIGIEPQP